MKEHIKNQIESSYKIKKEVLENNELIEKIENVAKICIFAYKNNKKILVCGNGGSAADAQHFAGELVSKFYFDRPALAAIALTTDTSILTAIGNDYGYEDVFSRQVEAIGNEGDVFIGISTSGSSKNVVKALKASKEKGLITVSLTGNKLGDMDKYSDYMIKIPSSETPRIQESHLLVEHILCFLIEKEIFGTK